jgi:hydroxysqualene synthase
MHLRTADDLADEGDATAAQRLADLQAYGEDLRAIARGVPASARWSAVFIPLQKILLQHALPVHLLQDLLSAFTQDLSQSHYPDRPALLDYCSRSANPIGRLLLHLYGIAVD